MDGSDLVVDPMLQLTRRQHGLVSLKTSLSGDHASFEGASDIVGTWTIILAWELVRDGVEEPCQAVKKAAKGERCHFTVVVVFLGSVAWWWCSVVLVLEASWI